MPQMTKTMAEAIQSLPKFDAESLATSKYYKGGFDAKMNKREASLILGISPTASKTKVYSRVEAVVKQCNNLRFISIADQRCSQEDYVGESSGSWWFTVFGSQNQWSKRFNGQCKIVKCLLVMIEINWIFIVNKRLLQCYNVCFPSPWRFYYILFWNKKNVLLILKLLFWDVLIVPRIALTSTHVCKQRNKCVFFLNLNSLEHFKSDTSDTLEKGISRQARTLLFCIQIYYNHLKVN